MSAASDAIDYAKSDLSAHIRAVFAAAKSEGRPVFSAYTTIGFPSLDETGGVIGALQAAGADLIELGVPFSDPMAEGPTIQKSNQRALDNGVNSIDQCLTVVKRGALHSDTPALLFSRDEALELPALADTHIERMLCCLSQRALRA
jgi:tryptophan synthase alpha subunit